MYEWKRVCGNNGFGQSVIVRGQHLKEKNYTKQKGEKEKIKKEKRS